MTITIRNDSVAAVVRGYIVDSRNTIVWLELAPQHPKTIGAIWADLVVQQRPWLQLGDHTEKRGLAVRGLGSRYERLTADAPDLALGHNAKARLLRLIAPNAIKANDRETFYILDWPNVDADAALAAMLERDTRWPVQMGWGKYLLHVGLEEGFIKPLTKGGRAPQGYEVQPPPSWGEVLASGLKHQQIAVQG
jgi:hypothetical protein